ncbi:hypothetical protein BB561_004401 [Smittium simulii]|uniref:Uncharacterized protein n=1 Tax=Smittium simulii TaxID=133385 RepID=A0A2T9YGD4_9FUNG|nr:hypothetical protein BB561_004401 [Smittium simulii]
MPSPSIECPENNQTFSQNTPQKPSQTLTQGSSVYASFLAQKIENQRVERIKKAERKEKKARKRQKLTESSSPKPKPMQTRNRGNKISSYFPSTKKLAVSKTNLSDTDKGYQNLPDTKVSILEKQETPINSEHQNNDIDEEHDKNAISEQSSLPMQPKGIVGTMRKYQLEGMDWLISLYENGLNGILADEMGLGKTLQTISFLTFLREQNVYGPFLIVCPLSTLGNWVSEFKKFSPLSPVLLYHGTPEERTLLRKRNLNQQLGAKFPVVVTTYEIVMRDSKYLKHFAWKYIVVDEGHRLKNLNCLLIKELKSYQSANRLLLTGTPLQNKLSELWSLLNFLLPDIFDDLGAFQEWFDFDDISQESGQTRIISQENTDKTVSKLHHILQPFLLRRLKSEVEYDLPPKREYLISCPMTMLQLEYYKATLNNEIRDFLQDKLTKTINSEIDSVEDSDFSDSPLFESIFKKNRKAKQSAIGSIAKNIQLDQDSASDLEFDFAAEYSLETAKQGAPTEKIRTKGAIVKQKITNMHLKHKLMQLRKISNHPYIFDFPVVDPNDPESEYIIDESLIRSSGKMIVLDILLSKLVKQGHRVLLFSQMTKMMDILEHYFTLRKHKFCRIDGSVPHDERRRQINNFNNYSDISFFLLSTRAGGLGINLTSADTVVIVDSDWNPQMDLQAMDRVHRIGQTKPVIVYRLATVGSIDEYIQNRANSKRKLEKIVIHQKQFKGIAKLVNTEDSLKNNSPEKNFEKQKLGLNTNDNDGFRGNLYGANIGLDELTEILLSDKTEGVRQSMSEVAEKIAILPLDQPIPSDLVISNENMDLITDRSAEAYQNSKSTNN